MNQKRIILAGGCFWGVEKFFSLLNGVTHTETAYVNGEIQNPSYEQVCNDNTNHAEAILVEYDNHIISLKEILEYFYQIIDPTSINKQGNDTGPQYRTGIYYEDPLDKTIIQDSLDQLQHHYTKKIAIELAPLQNYTKAEDHHQQYLNKNPDGYCHLTEEHFNIAKNRK